MTCTTTVKWTSGKNKALAMPDKALYAYARMVLDTALPTIPMDIGKLRKTSMTAGVQKTATGYKIGSYTTYAEKMYNKTSGNWTTVGTHGKWFSTVINERGTMLMSEAVARYKL